MGTTPIRDEIRDFIRKELLLDARNTPLEDETRLLDEALIDSLGVFKLAAFIEERYGVEIRDVEMVPEHFGSVGSLERLVGLKRGIAPGDTPRSRPGGSPDAD